MTIPFQNYVDITSSVGGNGELQATQLITRIITSNPLVPTYGSLNNILQFSNAAAVGNYFGTSSEEYLRSLFYFSWVSKLYTSASLISFSYWASANTYPLIFGANLSSIGTSLSDLNTITTGTFTLTIGGVTNTISGLDFSLAGSLAAVATDIQTAIRTQTGTQWTEALVTYDNTTGAFNFQAGDNSLAANVSIATTSLPDTDVSQLLGWSTLLPGVYPLAPIFSNGIQTETVTATLTNSTNTSNNFGSYLFEPSLTQDQVVESATWNSTQGNLFQYLVPVNSENAVTYATALTSIGGTDLTINEIDGEYAEQVPGMILAATPYQNANSTQNYMFQQFNLTPSVSDGNTAATYDAAGVNYYGISQQAGQQIAFYQRGVMTGASVSTNAIDQNVYANEQWLINANSAALGTLLVGSTEISANAQGCSQTLAVLEEVIGQALSNGVISVGAELSSSQIADILSLTNDPTAPSQIQSIGYWVNTFVTQVGSDYFMNYLEIYKKNDVIRKIIGQQILI